MSLVWAYVSGYKYCFCSNKICILQLLGIANNSLILSVYSSLPLTSRTSHPLVHVCVWHQRTLQNGIIRWEQCIWMSASLCPSNEDDGLCVLVPGASVYLSNFSLISTVTAGPFNSMPSPFCPEQLKWSPPQFCLSYTLLPNWAFLDFASLGSLALSARCPCHSLPAAGSTNSISIVLLVEAFTFRLS